MCTVKRRPLEGRSDMWQLLTLSVLFGTENLYCKSFLNKMLLRRLFLA